MIMGGQAGVTSGILKYTNFFGQRNFMAYVQVFSFIGGCLLCEILFQIIKYKQDPFKRPSETITIDEFSSKIKSGEKLVILDDLVLDVSGFMRNHAGGRFVIEQNVGRDISKFFYGGYILEPQAGNKPHTHSNIARKIVNVLSKYTLHTESPVMAAKITSKAPINNTTSTITFTA